MAKSIFLTSTASVAANQSVIQECAAKQALPSWLVAQLGNRTVAVATENLSASIFAVSAREDGGFSLKVSLSGTVVNGVVVPAQKGNYNFKLSGWVIVYPEGADAPEGASTVSENELSGIVAFSKGSKLWYDLSHCPRVYLVLAIVEESHYVRDEQGNKIIVGNKDGKPVFKLGTHQVISFALGCIDAPICGNGTGGSGTISTSDKASADAALDLLLAGGRSV